MCDKIFIAGEQKMAINEILKALRLKSGLPQKELAEALGIGQATIACYEGGQRDPQVVNLVAYADYFDCSVDYLVGRTDERGNVKFPEGLQRSYLKEDEAGMLDKYRALNKNARMKLLGYLDALQG